MIDKIYIINLDKRTDRWKHIEENVIPKIPIKYQLCIERFSAIDHTEYKSPSQRAAGCTYSHLNIWKKSIESNYNNIVIMEDDIYWIQNEEFINYIFNKIENLNYDICNFSYFNKAPLTQTNHQYFYNCNNVQTTGGYFASVGFLDHIYTSINESAQHLMLDKPRKQYAIDITWKKFQNNSKWFVCEKLARQRADFSDIEGTNINYNFC